MAFTKISHAQQDWENVINDNLNKTQEIQNTGHQALTMLAPATGNLGYQIFNNVLYLDGAVKPNASGIVDVAIVPSGISTQNFSVVDENGGVNVRAAIGATTHVLTLVNVPTSGTPNYALDGHSMYVGNINLGG